MKTNPPASRRRRLISAFVALFGLRRLGRCLLGGLFFAAAFFAVVFLAASSSSRPSSSPRRAFFAGARSSWRRAFVAPCAAPDPSPASRPASRAPRSMVSASTRLPAPQRRVGLAVGDVRAEPAVLDDQRLLGDRVVPSSRSGGAGGPAAAGLRRGEQRQRLLQGDREDLLLGLQRPGVVAPLDVRAVPAGCGEDLARRRGPRRPAGAASAPCSASSSVSVSGDCDAQQRGVLLAGGHVRPVPAGLEHDRLAGLRVLAELALAAAAEEQLVDLLRGQLVRRDAVRQRTRSPARRPRLRRRGRRVAGAWLRCRYGPYRPTRTTTSRPASSVNSGIELIPRASISPRFSVTILFSPPRAGDPASRRRSSPPK